MDLSASFCRISRNHPITNPPTNTNPWKFISSCLNPKSKYKKLILIISPPPARNKKKKKRERRRSMAPQKRRKNLCPSNLSKFNPIGINRRLLLVLEAPTRRKPPAAVPNLRVRCCLSKNYRLM